MPNNLSIETKTAAVSMLCEGSSIRGIERITGVHRDTIMRLGVRMGEGCAKIMDERFRGLNLALMIFRRASVVIDPQNHLHHAN